MNPVPRAIDVLFESPLQTKNTVGFQCLKHPLNLLGEVERTPSARTHACNGMKVNLGAGDIPLL